MNVLVLGSSGLVGSHVLRLALAHPRITAVIAPSRGALPAHAKLSNPVTADLQGLVARVPEWAPAALICALGTTMAKAGSKPAFREVDFDLPLRFATAARSSGTKACALVTAAGASPDAWFFYPRTKGQLEEAVRSLDFESLTIVRPSLIGGQRQEHRAAEHIAARVLQALGPVIPKRFRISPAASIAGALINAVVSRSPGIHVCRADTLL